MTIRAKPPEYACAGCGVVGTANTQLPVGTFDRETKRHVINVFCRDGFTIKAECRKAYNERAAA